jgi:alpha-galactosidase
VVAFTGANGGGELSVAFKDVPGMQDREYEWKELYSGQTGAGSTLSFNVAQDDIAIFKIKTTAER